MKLNSGFIEYVETHAVVSVDLEAEVQDNENIREFASVLKDHRHINTLEFAESHISDEQLRLLSEAISKNQSLLFIDFGFNPITEQGMNYLADALKENTSIQVINLSGIEMTTRSIELLNKAICESKSIMRVIPGEIMTLEARQIISHKEAWKTILELIANRSSTESPNTLLSKVCEIAQKHYPLPTQDLLVKTTDRHSPGIFS